MNERCPLSSELKVACEIYRFNLENKPIWFSKLVESLDGELNKNIISESLDTLFDWIIIYGEYGATENGRAGYLLYIYSDEMKKSVNYMKNTGKRREIITILK